MRWGLILILSAVGVLMAAGSVYGLYGGFARLVFIPVWIFYAVIVGVLARGKYFLHGLLTGAISSAAGHGLRLLLFDVYMAHNPWHRELMERLPADMDPNKLALLGSVSGVVIAAVAVGFLALLAGRVFGAKKSEAPKSGLVA